VTPTVPVFTPSWGVAAPAYPENMFTDCSRPMTNVERAVGIEGRTTGRAGSP
jgi:hypothetical protein